MLAGPSSLTSSTSFTSSTSLASSTSLTSSTTQIYETITISMDVFVVNLTAIALGGTPFLPGAPAVTVNGEAISADASGDLFAGGTEILSGPSDLAKPSPFSNTASSSSSSTVSTTITSDPSSIQETITIGTEIFAINPTDIILDGTRVVPGAPAVTVDGEVISAGAQPPAPTVSHWDS